VEGNLSNMPEALDSVHRTLSRKEGKEKERKEDCGWLSL
jgi:hypothetical protein